MSEISLLSPGVVVVGVVHITLVGRIWEVSPTIYSQRTVSNILLLCQVSAERKALLDEKLAFKPEPPGSTEEDGDVVKENIRSPFLNLPTSWLPFS